MVETGENGVSAEEITEFSKHTKPKSFVQFDGLEVLCHIRDVKPSYGRLRVRVEPVHGRGSQWINASRVLSER